MRAKNLIIALAAASSLLACGSEPLAGEEAGSLREELKRSKVAEPTYALKSTDAFDATLAPVWKTSFPIYSTYTLYLATEISGVLPGHHLASVYLIAPGGSVYQRLDVGFATDVAAASGEQQAQKTAAGYRVWVSVPVAATTIQQLNLIGTWSAEAWIDAASAPNARAAFTLN